MPVWIILLLLAFVLSPLAMLMPSRRQRGRMDVRLQARRMGLAMQLSREQWPHWLAIEPPGQCLNQWREPCGDASLAEQLASLPVDVYKVEATTQMIALYWGEREELDSLQKIASFLLEIGRASCRERV